MVSPVFTLLLYCMPMLVNSSERKMKIIGGVEAVKGRYPYQVSLGYQNVYTGEFSHFCGGSLIAPDWVMTAAHCSGAVYVQIGRHDFSNSTEIFEMLAVDYEIPHPNTNAFTMQNDIMLLKLNSSSTYEPVLIPESEGDPPAGSKVTVIGWGSTESEDASSVLREVEVDVVGRCICRFKYILTFFSPKISEDMMCAARDGKDSCYGDSGGPLLFKGSDASSDVVVGIVSWGLGCASPMFPGVYARVDHSLDFIKATMENHNSGDFFGGDGFDYSNCTVPASLSYLIGNGECDEGVHNTPACNFDGGDCKVSIVEPVSIIEFILQAPFQLVSIIFQSFFYVT